MTDPAEACNGLYKAIQLPLVFTKAHGRVQISKVEINELSFVLQE